MDAAEVDLTYECPQNWTEYEMLINQLRGHFRFEVIRNVGVLPFRVNNTTKYVHLTLVLHENGNEFSFTAKFRRNDMYIVAVKNKENHWYALRGADFDLPVDRLPLDCSYESLLTCSSYNSVNNVPLTYIALKEAIMVLSGLSNVSRDRRKAIGKSIVTIVMFFAEAGRFNSVKRAVIYEWSVPTYGHSKTFIHWMTHSWGHLSKFHLNSDNLDEETLNASLEELAVANIEGKIIKTVKELEDELELVVREQKQDDSKYEGKDFGLKVSTGQSKSKPETKSLQQKGKTQKKETKQSEKRSSKQRIGKNAVSLGFPYADLLIKHEDIVQILEDFLHSLAPGSECTITTRVLQNFDRVKNVWGNRHFVGVLRTVVRDLPSVFTYRLDSRWRLAEFIMRKIKSESSLEDVFEYQDKVAMMRYGLSILIDYWSNEDMIGLVLAMGAPSLFTLVKGEDIEEGRRENEVCPESSAPIENLRQDSSIKELADQLLKIPKAVTLDEELLISLHADVASGKRPYGDYYILQSYATLKFWFNPLIVMELIKALKQSKPPLVNVLKKYSKIAQVLRWEEKFTRIQRDPRLSSVLESNDPVCKMRGMLSILFGYGYDRDVCEFFRCIHAAEIGLKEHDDVEVVEYVAQGPGDVEGLKRMLAEKYSKYSEEYMDRFDKIMKFIEMKKAGMEAGIDLEEKIMGFKEMKKADMESGFDLALVIVVLRNGNVVSLEVITEFF